VDQLRRSARRPAAEVAAVDERHGKAVRCCRLGNRGSDDPAPDHEQVVAPLAELGQRSLARR
jgi:hypothetical protein